MKSFNIYMNPEVQKWYDDNIKSGIIANGLSTRFTVYLWKEWKDIDNLCAKRKATSPNPRQPSLFYIVRRKNVMGLPTEYEIWYRCKSIVGVKGDTIPREPIFGYLHKMSIVLPNNYPSADGNPIFTFRTEIWHPNIRHSGSFKGHVCLNTKENGIMLSLKECILRIEKYLKYQIYHAENTYPFPEDPIVSEWVRKEGEPNNWTRFAQIIPEASILPQRDETEGRARNKPILL